MNLAQHPNLFTGDPVAPVPAPAPATEKQLAFAASIAKRTGKPLPQDAAQDRKALSAWIDAHKAASNSRLAALPSAKQVAFAERIARLKRREVPAECFKDRTLMSRWIDGNKPR
ncbi:MAG: hypothetical protein AAF218_06255 [Pseudomonadota bacterium]